MDTSRFIGNTTWCAILLIIFGGITGVFPLNWWTVFSFIFLCVVGVFTYGYVNARENKRRNMVVKRDE